ncbi:hypothetical protein L332_08715 [Agrococcus pavilionensis RW1]|uniref:Uncharacterized protein n=1 Tax=Agrococcus pavilionensis RW1 TaxID=1330458 RepID=U1LBM3_9MICO|nr:hypothetical protein L332_08715 [Agrococcus pavilionensis RW1]
MATDAPVRRAAASHASAAPRAAPSTFAATSRRLGSLDGMSACASSAAADSTSASAMPCQRLRNSSARSAPSGTKSTTFAPASIQPSPKAGIPAAARTPSPIARTNSL